MELKQSPLFEPVLWEGGRFKILDETVLPWKVDYIPVDELSQALQAVKGLVPGIGVAEGIRAALKALAKS